MWLCDSYNAAVQCVQRVVQQHYDTVWATRHVAACRVVHAVHVLCILHLLQCLSILAAAQQASSKGATCCRVFSSVVAHVLCIASLE